MPSQDGSFEAGELAQLVGLPGLEGAKVTVVRNLAKDKWAVMLEGEEKKSKVVSVKNLKKLASAGPPTSYSIVGTWDEWESHEMTWDASQGCFEYIVIIGSTGTESFKILMDGDWDSCVYPDRNDANPYEEHTIRGPDDGGSDVEWTVGVRKEDGAHEGAICKVCFYVFSDGRPKCVRWEAPGAGGNKPQESSVQNGAPAAPRAAQSEAASGMRRSVKDLLKKGPSGGSNNREEPPAPAPARAAPAPEREAPKRSMLPRSLVKKAEAPAEPAPAEPAPARAAAPAAAAPGPKAAPPRAAAREEPARTPAPAAEAAPASAAPKPLGTVLREVRPQATAQDLAMAKSKLMQIGIKSTDDLLGALKEGGLADSLAGAGLATASDLVQACAGYFGVTVPARGSAPARAKSAPKAKAAPTVPKPKLWEIVGGADTGGLRVRKAADKNAEAMEEKLACGAVVEELELVESRLHYKKHRGVGPEEGWILVDLKGRELARRVDDVEEEKAEEAAAEEEKAAEQEAPRAAPPRAEQARPAPVEIPVEMKQKAQRLQVNLDQLHNQDPEHLAEFLDRIERVHKSTASKLQAQYGQLGFPVDEDEPVERAEMARVVGSALLWQELSLLPLQEVCAKQGMDVLMEQPREELLQLLKNSSWEKAGIPITRIPEQEDAKAVFMKVRSLEIAGPNQLVADCKRHGLPTSASTDAMKSQLKQAFVWKALPAHELLRECKAHNLSPSVGDLAEESTREELYQQLVNVMWNNRCEARGIPAKRLGSAQLSDELLEQVDHLQVMGPLSLQAEYRRMGITYDPKLDMQATVDRLRDMLIWEALPLGELQEDCRQRGLPHSDGRKAMLQRLRQRLDHELELEAQGLPVRRLGGYEAAMELMEQYEAIDQMSTEDLVEWYKGTGCPEDKNITKEELLQLVKAMAVWEALPLTELSQECVQNKVVVKDLRQMGNEDDQREFLVTKLLQQQRMNTWEESGFKAERIGDFQAMCQLIRQYNQFASMSNEDLERSYARRGLPREPSTDRAAMLENLKMVLIWEALPLFDLQMDALERSEKIQCDFESKGNENEQKSSLIRQLTVEALSSAYEHIGVPVERIGFLEAYTVGRDLVSFTIMEEQELMAECEKFGLTVTPDMTCAELVTRLREYNLWDVLPAEDLFAEAVRRGVQEQLREQILGVLLAQQ